MAPTLLRFVLFHNPLGVFDRPLDDLLKSFRIVFFSVLLISLKIDEFSKKTVSFSPNSLPLEFAWNKTLQRRQATFEFLASKTCTMPLWR